MKWDTQFINMFSLWISLNIILIFCPPQNSPQKRRKRSLFQAGKWGSHQGVTGLLSLFALKAQGGEDVSECLRSKLIKDQFLIFISPKDSKANIPPPRGPRRGLLCCFMGSSLTSENRIPQEKFTPNRRINIPSRTLCFRKGL